MTLTDSPVRPGAGERKPAVVEVGIECVSSQIMPQVLADLQAVAPLVVLDLGFGMPETVSYFNDPDHPCRLHFVGLQELVETGSPVPDGQSAGDHWHGLFRTALGSLRESRFDLLLCWDFLNFLDEPAVQGLNRALRPYVDERTHGHGFLAPNSTVNVPARRCSLVSEDSIAMRAVAVPCPPVWQRPHGRLARLLDAMTIGHSVLRHGGMLELSLRGAG